MLFFLKLLPIAATVALAVSAPSSDVPTDCDGQVNCRCLIGQTCDPGLDCHFSLCWEPSSVPKEYLYSKRYQDDAVLIRGLIADALSVGKDDRVADIGAGRGSLAVRFADIVGTAGRVYATDIRAEAVETLREHAKQRPSLEPRLARAPRDTGLSDLADDTLTHVLMINSVRFQTVGRDEDLRYLREFVRLLRPGGRFAYHMDWFHPGYLKRASVEALFGEAGFKLVRSIPMPAHIPATTTWYDLGYVTTLERGTILIFEPGTATGSDEPKPAAKRPKR